MPIYYVDGIAGSDFRTPAEASNPSTPWQTLNHALGVAAAGDELRYSGMADAGQTAGESNVLTGAQDNLTIRQYSAGTTHISRGAWAPAGVSAWVGGPAVYTNNTGPTRPISHVVRSFDTLRAADAYGRGMGFLIPCASAAICAATAQGWHYDSITGVCTINTGAAWDPNALTGENAVMVLETTTGTQPGITVPDGATGVTIDGGEFRLYGGASSTSWGLNVGGNNNTVRNITVRSCGVHAVTLYSGTGGGSNLVEDCVAHGMLDSLGSANFTAYGNNSNVNGSVFRRCTSHAYQSYKADGTKVGANIGVGGWYCHCAPGFKLVDLLIDSCTSLHYDSPGDSFQFADTAPPTDARSFQTYPVRILSSKQTNGSGNNPGDWCAFKGCFFDWTQNSVRIGGNVCTMNAASTAHLYDSCVFVFNGDTGANLNLFLPTGELAKVIFINCTFIDIGTGAGNRRWYDPYYVDAFTIECYSSLICYRTAGANNRLLEDDGVGGNQYGRTATPTNTIFQGNCYVNVTAGGYSRIASKDTFAEWQATVDTTGFELTPGQVALEDITSVDPAICGKLSSSSLLRTAAYKRYASVTPSSQAGFGGSSYDGTVGAYQYGGGGVDSTNSYLIARYWKDQLERRRKLR